jgi:hypothetical protein
MGERVRVQSELHELERQAIWNAHFRQARRWRLPRLFLFRKLNTDKRSTATVCAANAEA